MNCHTNNGIFTTRTYTSMYVPRKPLGGLELQIMRLNNDNKNVVKYFMQA